MSGRKVPPRCVILGGGGHARVLMDCMRRSGEWEPFGVLDANPEKKGLELDGVLILGGDEVLPSLVKKGIRFFSVGLGSIKDTAPRKRLYETALRAGLTPAMVRHPSALVSSQATIDQGDQFFPGCVLNAGASLGVNVVLNSLSVVEHDCVLADHVFVGPGAVLGGGVLVGVGAHIGTGASIRQGVIIGARAVVGMGAAVLCDVPEGTMVAGVPAKPLSPVFPLARNQGGGEG